MIENKGSFSFVLHAHLPYVVNHGVWPHGMEWLFEAAAETYIPILNAIKNLSEKNIPVNLNISFSSILISQLKSEEFRHGFLGYLGHKEKLAAEDISYFMKLADSDSEKEFISVAKMWLKYYTDIRSDFIEKYQMDLIAAYSEFQKKGVIEILTTTATHAYLPLLKKDEWVEFQIEIAKNYHKAAFGEYPKGIWLPECGYRPSGEWRNFIDGSSQGFRPGVEVFLEEAKFNYFIVDTHMLTGKRAIGSYNKISSNDDISEDEKTYKIHLAGKGSRPSSVSFFTRDPDTGIQVWSAEKGYPGDRNYLEFHKKRFPSGLKYWKVTGKKVDLGDKQIYNSENTNAMIESHANHFVSMIESKVKQFGKEICVVSPYDAELFGHWWFEGPKFLEKVLEILGSQNREIQSQKLSDILSKSKSERKPHTILEGSWGDGGDHRVWYNENTKWTWEKIHWFEEIMIDFAKLNFNNVSLEYVLDIMVKQMLILQSSDWQFLITTWSARDYSEQRFQEAVNNFDYLFYCARRLRDGETLNQDEWSRVDFIRQNDDCFNDIGGFTSWRKIVRN